MKPRTFDLRYLKSLLFWTLGWIATCHLAHAQQYDPLPSWNEGAAKQSILGFVSRVSSPGSKDYVDPASRIAVFDNDGTLWPENPMPFQLAYMIDQVRTKAAADTNFAQDTMVQAALNGDIEKLIGGKHHDGLFQLMALTHTGMTTDEFTSSVSRWMATAKHPKYNLRYDQLTYQPMQEVLALLKAKGFKVFIVSGGGADFMRVWSERVYGIPPEQVIGSTARTSFEMRDGIPVLVKTLDHLFVDDEEGKPVGIHQFLGRRPIACFGNSDGDHAMLQYTTIGNPKPSFGMLVHHTDDKREYAYDSAPKSTGKLVEALQEAPRRGWTVANMELDWRQVFSK